VCDGSARLVAPITHQSVPLLKTWRTDVIGLVWL